jgi:DeoR family fructose operon transcriptional repressor
VNRANAATSSANSGLQPPVPKAAAVEAADARERQREILAMARANGRVDVSAVAYQFGVAAETIRRDLKILERNGLVRRSYGGAYPVERAGFETDISYRETNHVQEKQRIAQEAVRHLGEADTIFIDEGFLPSLIGPYLPGDRRLTIVTASLPVVAALAHHPSHSVILLGGLVRGRTLATVEHWATHMLEEFVIDLAFVGSNGISLTDGLTTPDPRVAEVKATAMRVARRKVFIGTYEKFGTVSFCRFARVPEFNLVITDVRLPVSTARQYMAVGPDVVRC